MRLVVKIAGALLERDEDVQALARQITELARAGHELLIVHGGGKIFTATLGSAWESQAASSAACASPIARRATRP